MPVTVRRLLLILGFLTVVLQCIALYGPPAPDTGNTGLPIDKFGHVAAFAVPTALFLLARVDWRLVVGLAVAQALLSELVQGVFLAERSGDVLDLAADAIGIALGIVVALLPRLRANKAA